MCIQCIADSLKIGMTESLIRLEIGPFSPLVPRIDEYNALIPMVLFPCLLDDSFKPSLKGAWAGIDKYVWGVLTPCGIVPARHGGHEVRERR